MVCSDCQVVVMSTTQLRDVVSTCDRCQAKMQAIADLLLLTSDLRPVTTDTLSVFGESYSSCRDTIIARTQGLNVLAQTIFDRLKTQRWGDIKSCMMEISDLVVGLIECCSHAVYLYGINNPHCSSAKPSIVDRYKICRANIEIKLCCDRLHDANPKELSGTCSEMSKYLTVLTECCENASEKIVSSPQSQNQFKLCFKSITSSASSLLTSIKSYQLLPTEVNHHIVLAFAEALMATGNAMVTFAAGDDFTGIPAYITSDVREIQQEMLGATMSIVSSCIQLLKTIKELVHDCTDTRLHRKLTLCMDSISRSSSQLSESLAQYNVEDLGQGTSTSKATSR